VDDKIRRLERSDDPIAKARGAQLRCRVAGCEQYTVTQVQTCYDPAMMATIIVVRMRDHEDIRYSITDALLARWPQPTVYELLSYMVEAYITKCPRCGESNGKVRYFTDIVMEKYDRQV